MLYITKCLCVFVLGLCNFVYMYIAYRNIYYVYKRVGGLGCSVRGWVFCCLVFCSSDLEFVAVTTHTKQPTPPENQMSPSAAI